MDGNLLETALCLSRKCKAAIRARGYKIQSYFFDGDGDRESVFVIFMSVNSCFFVDVFSA